MATESASGPPVNIIYQQTTASVPNIEKLEGQANYISWKFAMKISLELEGLFGYVDGSFDVLCQLDIERDAKALAKICFSVKTCCYIGISKAKTANEAWDNLKNAFEGHSMSIKKNRIRINQKTAQSEARDLGSMDKYINEILVTVQKLADMGEPIDDK
nr:unnamed protein product [Callosobruchus analis]